MCLAGDVCKLACQPELDQGLAGDASSLSLMVKGFDHPTREVDIDAFDIQSGPFGASEIDRSATWDGWTCMDAPGLPSFQFVRT